MLGTLIRRLLKGPPPMLQPGDLCPSFSVLDSDGNTVTDADFRGKRRCCGFTQWQAPLAERLKAKDSVIESKNLKTPALQFMARR